MWLCKGGINNCLSVMVMTVCSLLVCAFVCLLVKMVVPVFVFLLYFNLFSVYTYLCVFV